jgi:hypothetical protein
MLYMENFLEIIGVDWHNRLNVGQIFYTHNILGKRIQVKSYNNNLIKASKCLDLADSDIMYYKE